MILLLSTLDDANNKLITTVDEMVYGHIVYLCEKKCIHHASNSHADMIYNACKTNGLSRDVQNQINRILFKWSLYIPYEYLMVVQGIPLTRIYYSS